MTVDQSSGEEDQKANIIVLDAPSNMKREASLDLLKPQRKSHKTLDDTNTSRHYDSFTQNSKHYAEKEMVLEFATDLSVQNKKKDHILERDQRDRLHVDLTGINESKDPVEEISPWQAKKPLKRKQF